MEYNVLLYYAIFIKADDKKTLQGILYTSDPVWLQTGA